MPVGSPEATRGQPLSRGTFLPQLGIQYSDYEDSLDARHRNATLTLSLAAQVSDRLNLSASIPFKHLRLEANDRGSGRTEQGLGDMVAFAAWSPWAPEADPEAVWEPRRLSFLGGFRLPTGESDLDRFAGVGGEIVPLGSGTFDLLLGASYGVPLGKELRAFTTLLLTIPLTENDDEPPPGTFLGTKSAFSIFDRAGASWTPVEELTLYAAIDFLWKDRAEGTALSEDDGGTFFWFTPGLAWKGPGGGIWDLSVQIPLNDGNPSLSLTLAFPIGPPP